MISTILINGMPSDGRIEVVDSSVLRGDGCFEVLKAYSGLPLFLEEHLNRLEGSSSRLQLSLPDRSELRAWIGSVSAECGDCAVRVVVTRGDSLPGADTGTQVIVFAHTWEAPVGPLKLAPVYAPWHTEGIEWELAGAKHLSYAPNLAATRTARERGFDDALLIGRSGMVLEGPTSSVAWVADGRLETPGLDLGILDSITRAKVLEDARSSGFEVIEEAWPLTRLEGATEVMSLSTIREVCPVGLVGGLEFAPGPVTEMLRERFDQRVTAMVSSHRSGGR